MKQVDLSDSKPTPIYEYDIDVDHDTFMNLIEGVMGVLGCNDIILRPFSHKNSPILCIVDISKRNK